MGTAGGGHSGARADEVRGVGGAGDRTVDELCELFGVSRAEGYRVLARFREGGYGALEERSRRPHRSPTATSAQVVPALSRLKGERPTTWGPKKLIDRLKRLEPTGSWPSAATGHRILQRHGLVKARRRLDGAGRPRPGRGWRGGGGAGAYRTAAACRRRGRGRRPARKMRLACKCVRAARVLLQTSRAAVARSGEETLLTCKSVRPRLLLLQTSRGITPSRIC
jgi:transposase